MASPGPGPAGPGPGPAPEIGEGTPKRTWARKMPKRRRKFMRHAAYCLDRKMDISRTNAAGQQRIAAAGRPASPASVVTPSPRSRPGKRKVTTEGLEIELESCIKRHSASTEMLVEEREEKDRLTKEVDRQVVLRARDRKIIGSLRDLLAATRKEGRKVEKQNEKLRHRDKVQEEKIKWLVTQHCVDAKAQTIMKKEMKSVEIRHAANIEKQFAIANAYRKDAEHFVQKYKEQNETCFLLTHKHKESFKLNQSQHEAVKLKKQRKVTKLAKLVVAMCDMVKDTSESAEKQSTQLIKDSKALSKVAQTKSTSVVLLTKRCATLKEKVDEWKMKHDALKDELASLNSIQGLQEEVEQWKCTAEEMRQDYEEAIYSLTPDTICKHWVKNVDKKGKR